MISVSECAALAGLSSNELVLGASPSAKHRSLLSSYLLNAHRGLEAVRELIVADLRRFLDLGVPARAADLLIVLRMLLTHHPEARRPDLLYAPRRPGLVEVALADLEGFHDNRQAGVVLSFARRTRRVERSEPAGYFDRASESVAARRSARPIQLRGDS
ncbi:hypothetical protein [Methylosinus sp. Sm6]|uniref:hypothetical protein n=1 Tax=Methylosinus sp. Sm6 TaxID=2866948 RepID=UPI001C9990F1|nr:hypothetical protein [Methylosinus sp. Sm6]MBY6242745.1 hypothetical protein [Methylosinus sp. Sm6]